jgi:hypothetical protein
MMDRAYSKEEAKKRRQSQRLAGRHQAYLIQKIIARSRKSLSDMIDLFFFRLVTVNLHSAKGRILL